MTAGIVVIKMRSKLLKKLAAELEAGITTEVQVVYLMVGLRRLLEEQNAKQQYRHLLFHCDWVVHAHLSGPAAQEILELFNTANIHLKKGSDLDDLPNDVRKELNDISQMKRFEEEVMEFLGANELPKIDQNRVDGWIHFLHLYAQVIEDSALVISGRTRPEVKIEK